MLMIYDLVVIGNNEYAYQLVMAAIQKQARVAWVIDRTNILANTNHLAKLNINLHQLSDRYSDIDKFARYTSLVSHLLQLLDEMVINERQILDALRGVDILYGEYNFVLQSSSHYILEVKTDSGISQYLSTNAFAIANHSDGETKENLSQSNYPRELRTIFGIWELTLDAPHYNRSSLAGLGKFIETKQIEPCSTEANRVVILGSDGFSCAIAQILNLLGMHVTMILPDHHILPLVDVAIARLLQAQMEVAHIEIYTHTQVTAIKEIAPDSIRLWTNYQTIDCNYFFVPDYYPHQGNAQVPLSFSIYPCQSYADIDSILTVALQASPWQRATSSIFKQFRKSSTYPNHFLQNIPTVPAIAQVQVAEKWDSLQSIALESVTTDGGLCKVICDRHGYIVGASICSNQAEEILEAIALAMQGRIKVCELCFFSENLANLFFKEQWQQSFG
ncbi:MAG: NAD-binding protein [Pseudanabaenaceae cyanobacterium bins.39]|nr:NAD-binding protein [Pseudanabaenaceae cyanobacterium bins.39]